MAFEWFWRCADWMVGFWLVRFHRPRPSSCKHMWYVNIGFLGFGSLHVSHPCQPKTTVPAQGRRRRIGVCDSRIRGAHFMVLFIVFFSSCGSSAPSRLSDLPGGSRLWRMTKLGIPCMRWCVLWHRVSAEASISKETQCCVCVYVTLRAQRGMLGHHLDMLYAYCDLVFGGTASSHEYGWRNVRADLLCVEWQIYDNLEVNRI